MPSVSCPVPEPFDQAKAKRIMQDTIKRYPKLTGRAVVREAARRAGVDEATFTAVKAGRKVVPSTKTPVKRVTKPDPMPVAKVDMVLPPPSPVSVLKADDFDWSRNLSSIKNAAHKDTVSGVMDNIGRVTGNEALRGIRVEVRPTRSMPDGAMGAHVSDGSVLLSSETMAPKFATEAARMQKSGYWVKTSNLSPAQSTMTHEIGHAIIERYATPNLMRDALKGLADDIDSRLSFGNTHVVDKWIQKNQQAINNRVSRYGGTEADELYAEMWTMYIDDPVHCPPYIKHFGDTIVQEIKRRVV